MATELHLYETRDGGYRCRVTWTEWDGDSPRQRSLTGPAHSWQLNALIEALVLKERAERREGFPHA